MGIRFNFGPAVALPADEQVLYRQRRFRVVSAKSPPSYRLGFQLPPFWLMTLYVTNRRIVL